MAERGELSLDVPKLGKAPRPKGGTWCRTCQKYHDKKNLLEHHLAEITKAMRRVREVPW